MIRNFYKYARNRYVGDSLNNIVGGGIDMTNFYMCINVNEYGILYVFVH